MVVDDKIEVKSVFGADLGIFEKDYLNNKTFLDLLFLILDNTGLDHCDDRSYDSYTPKSGWKILPVDFDKYNREYVFHVKTKEGESIRVDRDCSILSVSTTYSSNAFELSIGKVSGAGFDFSWLIYGIISNLIVWYLTQSLPEIDVRGINAKILQRIKISLEPERFEKIRKSMGQRIRRAIQLIKLNGVKELDGIRELAGEDGIKIFEVIYQKRVDDLINLLRTKEYRNVLWEMLINKRVIITIFINKNYSDQSIEGIVDLTKEQKKLIEKLKEQKFMNFLSLEQQWDGKNTLWDNLFKLAEKNLILITIRLNTRLTGRSMWSELNGLFYGSGEII